MKRTVSIFLVTICGIFTVCDLMADEPANLKPQLEQAAGEYFSLPLLRLIYRRPPDDPSPQQLKSENTRLFVALKGWSDFPDELRKLAQHRDPKVRTLALGALYVRESPHDLPFIAALAEDKAKSFYNHDWLYDSGNNYREPRDEGFLIVGEVARAMLNYYLIDLETTDFQEYWQARKDRQVCASWMLVRLNRATQGTSPLQEECIPDVKEVLADVQKLLLSYRAWIKTYLRSLSSIKIDSVLTDKICLEDLKAVGPDEVLRFIRRERVSDDPDLQFENLNPEHLRRYSWMVHFLLRRATDVLRPEDAPILIELERAWRNDNELRDVATPYWACAAVELIAQQDISAANAILKEALVRFRLKGISGGKQQAVLMSCLWHINGVKQQQTIVDWFYAAQSKVKQENSDSANHGPYDLLRSVREMNRPDTKDLMKAIVSDERFDQTDYPALEQLLMIANDGLENQLIENREIYQVWGWQREPQKAETFFKVWREKLRHHYQK